jgi:hypothetical protein
VLLLIFLASGLNAQDQSQGQQEPGQSQEPSDDTGGEDSQSAANKALDSTATQWSFQGAYQMMPDYHNDTMSNGQTRPDGADNYWQLRIVAPLPFEKLTILPRVTIRHYENGQGDSGFGNTEIFGLIIPKGWDWGSGRFGVGPLVTLPGSAKVARDEWGYGFATAAVNSSGKWFYGALLTQSWRAVDPTAIPPTSSDTNPLGIVARYDWKTKKFYLPIGVRFGKVFVMEKGTWNFYFEYQTSAIYKDWLGPAVKNSFRFNVTYTIPVG